MTLAIASYPGSKKKLIPFLREHLPGPSEAQVWCEPFCGMGVYLINSPHYEREVISDSNLGLYSMFKALQDPDIFRELQLMLEHTPVNEATFREALAVRLDTSETLLHRAWGMIASIRLSFCGRGYSFGYMLNREPYPHADHRRLNRDCLKDISRRLRSVQCFSRDFREIIRLITGSMDLKQGRKAIIWCDPPYPDEVSASSHNMYARDFGPQDHEDLLDLCLEAAGLPNIMVALSSYPNSLYDRRLSGWRREDVGRISTMASQLGAVERTECLYMSYPPLQRGML